MAAERAHKTPGCPLGARDSWPAALTGAEGDICQAGTETKVAKPAGEMCFLGHWLTNMHYEKLPRVL